jgi:DNA repair exonuclease SbcCD ATPase subunit
MDAYESWEMAVRKVYEQHACNLQAQVRAADDKAKELYVRVQEHLDLLKEQEDAKQKLRDDVAAKQFQLNNALEDIATTRKNYDTQLAILTEHICNLSARLSDKDANVATLHTHKVLCGHCGMWNAMGKLLAPETGGKCNTCKEKVLNPS